LRFYRDAITGTLVVTDTVPALAAGGAITLTTPWNFGSLPPGDYGLAAAVNQAQADFAETLTDNNSTSLSLGVQPDLAVSPLYFWADRLPDGRLAITGTIYNFGSVPAANVVATVYANDPLTDTARLFSRTISSLPPAESAVLTGTWAAPTSGYSLYLWADPESAITETTRANNLASTLADFDLDLQPPPVEVIIGQPETFTVTLTSRSGFAAPVSLSATGAVTGPVYSLAAGAAIPTTSVALTVTAAATMHEGEYPLVLRATSGGITHTVAVTLNVVAPNFAPYALPPTQTLVQDDSATYNVTIAPYHGFIAPVALTVTGLPAGVSYIVVPNPGGNLSAYHHSRLRHDDTQHDGEPRRRGRHA
jgi:hypothetical protein